LLHLIWQQEDKPLPIKFNDEEVTELARELQLHTAAGRLAHGEVVRMIDWLQANGYTVSRDSEVHG
jgi:hypothetical protein